MANESLPEVIAEMRERAEAMEIHGTTRGVKRTVLEFAARIDAAAKRAEDTVGNAAAMRETLEIAKKAICHHAKHLCQSLSWENSNIQSNCADILCAHRDLCEAKTAINSALSAPPRNCDRFSGADEAKKEFNYLWNFVWKRGGGVSDGRSYRAAYDRWLFAPAEKGDRDA